MTGAPELAITQQPQHVAQLTWAWALKRAALGLAILTVMITVFACLMYAGIEPDRAEATPHKVVTGSATAIERLSAAD